MSSSSVWSVGHAALLVRGDGRQAVATGDQGRDALELRYPSAPAPHLVPGYYPGRSRDIRVVGRISAAPVASLSGEAPLSGIAPGDLATHFGRVVLQVPLSNSVASSTTDQPGPGSRCRWANSPPNAWSRSRPPPSRRWTSGPPSVVLPTIAAPTHRSVDRFPICCARQDHISGSATTCRRRYRCRPRRATPPYRDRSLHVRSSTSCSSPPTPVSRARKNPIRV